MAHDDESADDTGHTRVYLVDDYPAIRDAIADTLSNTIDLEMCGQAAGLDETVYAERALRTGASGYLMKTEPPAKLVDAIRCIEQGDLSTDPCTGRQTAFLAKLGTVCGLHSESSLETNSRISSFAIDELTDREMEVFRLLGRGKAVVEIQEELGLNRKTVETYRRRAREKLGVGSVSELLQYATQWTQVHRTDDAAPDA